MEPNVIPDTICHHILSLTTICWAWNRSMLSIWWCDNANLMISDYLGKFPVLYFSRCTGHYVVIKQLLSWYPASAECIVAGLAKLSCDKYHSSSRYTRSTTYHGPAWSLGYFSDEASCSARSWTTYDKISSGASQWFCWMWQTCFPSVPGRRPGHVVLAIPWWAEFPTSDSCSQVVVSLRIDRIAHPQGQVGLIIYAAPLVALWLC